MPRLLLVDDNQRIHQIVETLLTATDIELTCASSGAEALELLGPDGSFDVALLDTTMQGMDGWELLDRLRRNGPTSRMPIAMMAGVLDVVDPALVDKAPIQGFLKKPVELRDLADRVRALLATPVEAYRPEPEPEPEPAAAPEPGPSQDFATMPYLRLSDHPLTGPADLLILEPSDLYEEEAPAPAEEPAFDAPLESLELEELDLESLKALNAATDEEPVPVQEVTSEDLPELAAEDAYQTDALDLGVVTDELPDLGPESEPPTAAAPEETTQAIPIPAHLYAPTPTVLPVDWSDDSDSLVGMAGREPWTSPAPAESRAAAMEEHSDFDPDSFLEQDGGPEPTPAFLPEVPEYVTPSTEVELIEEVFPSDAPAAAEVDALPEPAPEPVAPWATTLSLAEEIALEPEAAFELLDEPMPVPEEEPAFETLEESAPEAAVEELPESGPAAEVFAPEPVAEVFAPEPVAEVFESEPVAEAFVPEPVAEAFVPEPVAEAFIPEPVAEAFVPEPVAEAFVPEAVAELFIPEPVAEAFVPEAVAPAAGAVPAELGADALTVLLADPVLMDRLAKAIVARLGEQVLREVAWEVMPELADRIRRN